MFAELEQEPVPDRLKDLLHDFVAKESKRRQQE